MTTKQEWYIVVNPTAGQGQVRRQWARIQNQLDEQAWHYTLAVTDYAGHATELVRSAILAGHRHIMAVGGDGTNNEAINGIFSQEKVPSTEISYTPAAHWHRNDWIKAHGIPKQITAVLEMIKKGKHRFQDVGKVTYQRAGKAEERYFVNVAGMGYDAFVVQKAEGKKRWGGQLLYLWLALKCLVDYRLLPARVSFDGRTVASVFYTIHAGIAPYSGGGMRFVPHAQLTDGRLALTLIHKISKLKVLANLYRLYTGSIGKLAEVETHYAQSIRVEGVDGEQTLVEVDGEFLGETPVEFRVLAKALKVMVP